MTALSGLAKLYNFYGRFLPSFSRIGFIARRLPLRPVAGDFSGQTWLITGASGGIGRAAALGAAQRGASVIAVARSQDKLDRLKADLPADAPGSIGVVRTDFASMREVAALAAAIEEGREPIDFLVNNVGVLMREHGLTAEGFETSYATNLLGHYLLTERLLDAGALSREAVIINVTSGGLYNVPLTDRLLDMPAGKFSGPITYAAHKRAQLALTERWNGDRRCAGPLPAYAVHPGWADTAGVRYSLPTFRKILKAFLRNEKQGADTILWLAANRPAPRPGQPWFDRKARTAHVFGHTRQPAIANEQLFERLEADLSKAKGGEAA